MSETDKTIQQFVDEGFAHLQLLCCSVKLTPLDEMPYHFRHQTL
jgi:hypothetical protein